MKTTKFNKPQHLKKITGSNIQTNNINREELALRNLQLMLEMQLDIHNYYNDNFYNKTKENIDIKEYFKNIKLYQSNLIVQMFRENMIHSINVIDDKIDASSVIAGISQVDARTRTSDVDTYVPTPIPVLRKGIILAVSPELQEKYYNIKNNLSKFDQSAADNVHIPQVGDIITTTYFSLAENRFYVDKNKQLMDYVKNPSNYNLHNFEYMFKINEYDIESIELNGNFDKEKNYLSSLGLDPEKIKNKQYTLFNLD